MFDSPRVFLPLLITAFVISGCGSTVRGVGKDINRMGRGVKMIFISEKDELLPKEGNPSFADFFRTDKSASKQKR